MSRLLNQFLSLLLTAALLCALPVPSALAASSSKPQTAELVELNFPAGAVPKDSKPPWRGLPAT